MKKDLLTIKGLSIEDLNEIFTLSERVKRERGNVNYKPLTGKSVGLIFAKSSTRTRISFEVGVHELGGQPLYLAQGSTQLGRGETVADTAKVMSRYLHGIVIRTYSHADVEELAANASIPIINALTDDYHPCQIIADMLTMKEYTGTVAGNKMVFYGDGRSNIANSLICAAKLAGFELVIAAPKEFSPYKELMAGASNVSWSEDPIAAAKGADFVYTDVWVSMGFEEEREERMKIFQPYQINMDVIKAAKPTVKLLHCLPAHRGEELSAEVMDSEYSIVFDEAENRLHVQKAIMAMLIK